ncbi:MAG: primosomal protein N' [Parahaliea sp.]
MSILRLAVPSPLHRLFDYLPPEEASPEALASLTAGCRLRVPFGSRDVIGVLQAVVDTASIDVDQLRPALEILDEQSLLPPDLVNLCQWASSYYQHPLGEVFSAALPQQLRRGTEADAVGEKAWMLTERGLGLPPDALKRAHKQQQALRHLLEVGACNEQTLAEHEISPAALRELAKKGLAQRCILTQPPRRGSVSCAALTLNEEQQCALDAIVDNMGGFSCHLLEGVTGSGKTEVYLQLIADCLQRGQQALVLVPEIGLSPQTLARFQHRFDADIVSLHSGLAEGERYRAWEAARTGHAHIIIGTRSAVFVPMAWPGVIVIDEEHDSSYKQQDGFRYNARDLAIKRSQLCNCPVVLGSATPSLESLHNALRKRYQHHRLKQRAGGASPPRLSALDIRKQPLQGGLSEALLQAIGDTLNAGQQCLLFLNRRGYAPTLQCHDCGWIADCRHCDARLTVHRYRRQLRCHHCNARTRLPANCPQCRSAQLATAGIGTEQAEQYLQQHFSRWPIYRVDSDSMRGKGAMQILSNEVTKGEPCILLGTQMLTKGHHFPAVTLVAVLDTDALLFSADFRGEERMAQLLTQVAGRAGRAEAKGQVILQTRHPDHPLLQASLYQSYSEQAQTLLKQRQTSGLPPFGQLAMLRTDCSDANTGEDFLALLRKAFEQQSAIVGCQLIGPLPSPLPRRKGRYRSQLLLISSNRQATRTATRQLVELAQTLPRRKGLNWFIDIDPTEM